MSQHTHGVGVDVPRKAVAMHRRVRHKLVAISIPGWAAAAAAAVPLWRSGLEEVRRHVGDVVFWVQRQQPRVHLLHSAQLAGRQLPKHVVLETIRENDEED